MVYRIADDGAIQDRFEVTLQTGSTVDEQAGETLLLALGLPAPAILLAIEPLLLMAIDRTQSYPAAVECHAQRFMAFAAGGPRSVVRPGRDRLAAESRVRPLPARAGRLGGLCAPLRSPGLCGLSGSIVAGRSGSPVRIATLRLPATVPPARSAEHASRIRRSKESRSSPEAIMVIIHGDVGDSVLDRRSRR